MGERLKLSGGMSDPGDTATRDERGKKMRKSARERRPIQREGGVIQDK